MKYVVKNGKHKGMKIKMKKFPVGYMITIPDMNYTFLHGRKRELWDLS